MAKANSVNVLKPSVCFEVQRIIGISTGEGSCKSYQVQWAPSWISVAHLVGCEDLIEQFEYEQTEKETDIKIEVIAEHDSGFGTGLMSVNEKGVKATNAEGMKATDTEGMKGTNEEEIKTTNVHNDSQLYNDSQYTEYTNDNVLLNTNLSLHRKYSYLKARSRTNKICTNGNILSGGKTIQNTTDPDPTQDGQFPQDVEYFDKEYTTRYLVTSDKTFEHLSAIDNNCDIIFDMPAERIEAVLPSRMEMNGKVAETKIKEKETFNSNISNNLSSSDRNLMDQSAIPNKNLCCSICGRAFAKKAHLEKHALIHNEGKRFPCNICRRMFSDNVKLQVHLQTHIKGCQHHCTLCRKMFPTSSKLKRHIRVHTGERPFECEFCHKRFRQKNHLRIHVKHVHMVDV